jgi:hypothetical protein
LAAAVLALVALATGDGLFWLAVIAAVVRALAKDTPERPDHGALAQYVVLVAALAAIGIVDR